MWSLAVAFHNDPMLLFYLQDDRTVGIFFPWKPEQVETGKWDRWSVEKKNQTNKKNNTYDIARLTVSFFLHGKEGLATQLGAAGHADEAVDMEDLVHGSAARTFTYYVLSAACTAACGDAEDGKLRAHSTHTKGQITW